MARDRMKCRSFIQKPAIQINYILLYVMLNAFYTFQKYLKAKFMLTYQVKVQKFHLIFEEKISYITDQVIVINNFD